MRQFSEELVGIKMKIHSSYNYWTTIRGATSSNYQKNYVQLILNLLSVFGGSTHKSDRQLKLQPPYLSQQIDCIGIRIHTFVIVFICSFYHCNSPMVTNEFYFFFLGLFLTNHHSCNKTSLGPKDRLNLKKLFGEFFYFDW